MLWPFHDKLLASYWLKVFGLYALTEACIQLAFNFILNNFSSQSISNLEFHLIMWVFQCIMIWFIWWVAYSVYNKPVITQVFVNLLFFIVYSLFWFGPIQDWIRYLHQHLQQITMPVHNRLQTPVDTSVKYQILKHSFRLCWFFLANYFYFYRREEEQRLQLAVANKELRLKLLKWYLNPRFYFETISYLKQLSLTSPASCTRPILHLAKVMEYVIYDSREKLIDVSKEIHFLNHYVELINRQDSHDARFAIVTKGPYEKLKIAPLMLAGFIDSILSEKKGSASNDYEVNLQFSGNTMLLQITGNLENADRNFLHANDPLFQRLEELYHDKFSCRVLTQNNCIELSLNLNEQ